jgi:hypothetical protein
MMQCERCGATNQAHSRFCVSCGSPMLPAVAPQHQPVAPAPQYPHPGGGSQPAPQTYQRQAAPAWNPSPQPGPHVPQANPVYAPHPPPHGPPSSNLPFAETAAPPSREDFDRVQQARQAALNAYAAAARGAPASPHGSGSMPAAPGYGQPTYPPPHAPYPQATAAMPGVSQDPAEVPEGCPRILCGFLVTYEGDALGAFWQLRQGRNVVGREGAPLELDIRIAHPTTSSRHALLMASALPGRVKIEDLGSTNGTFVNEARLAPGQPVEVSDGDRIRFGLFPVVVKII